jgi:hypothetical protein
MRPPAALRAAYWKPRARCRLKRHAAPYYSPSPDCLIGQIGRRTARGIGESVTRHRARHTSRPCREAVIGGNGTDVRLESEMRGSPSASRRLVPDLSPSKSASLSLYAVWGLFRSFVAPRHAWRPCA